MTWYAVYDKVTKELYSTGTSIADVVPEHLLSKEFTENIQEKDWNKSTLAFDVKPPKVIPFDAVAALRNITESEFDNLVKLSPQRIREVKNGSRS